ncbi:hypothetical protein Tco_0033850 [Tanacetum coccineum]
MESDEFIKSSVDNLVPTPREFADLFDGERECDVPINYDSPESHFTTFSNPLFDSNDDFSSDDESLFEEEIQKDEFKYFSNPLYDLDDEIITNEKFLPNQKDLDVVIPIPLVIDERCFNAESDLLESLQNREIPIDSTKIDSIFDEFSLPRPPEIPSFSQDVMDLVFEDSIPPGIDDDDDSEGDILPLEELLDDVLFLLPKSDNFTFVEPVATMENNIEELNEDESFDPGEVIDPTIPEDSHVRCSFWDTSETLVRSLRRGGTEGEDLWDREARMDGRLAGESKGGARRCELFIRQPKESRQDHP